MNVDDMNQVTIGDYFNQWWQELPRATRKRWWTALGIFAAVWLAGAVHAPSTVAGLAGDKGLVHLFLALGMGGFSFLWRILKLAGVIQETKDSPNILWIALALVVPGIIGLFYHLRGQPANPLYGLRKKLEKAARAQGRVEAGDLKEQLFIEEGIPLVQIEDDKKGKVPLGLDYQKSEGHVMVIAPTRAGKSLHLTDTLRHYPGPALVIDPKAEQFERTAALREKMGPVYRIPGHQVHLSAYYRHLRDRDEAGELHYHLLRPWASSEPIFAEKAFSLFIAVGLYAREKRLNPIRLLLDLAESNPVEALTALRTVEAARRHVDIFTNGAAPDAYREDRFVTSALGNFTARLAPYQKHIDTIAPPDLSRRELIVPPDWAAQNATIYVTYSLNDLRAVGGVVAATVAAILRYQMRLKQAQKVLVAIDELPAVGLHNVADYLSTCGGYGITLLLYAQSVAQLQGLYGREGTRAILSNCDHQIWYPTAEMETAKFMSELYGTTLKASPMQSTSRSARRQQDREGRAQTQMTDNQGASWSWREGAALSPNEMMALPQGQVLAATRSTSSTTLSRSGQALSSRRLVFLGQRLNSIHLFDTFPSPDGLHLPQPLYRVRPYTDWQQVIAPQSAVEGDGREQADKAEVELAAGSDSAAATGAAAETDAPTADEERRPPGPARLMG